MKKLTQSSKGSICIKCGAPDAYSCHYNGPRQHSYGKGRGIKCNDLLTAEFCHKCDQEFTEGSMLLRWYGNKWERSEEFLHWICMTNIRRYNEGLP
jgi:hypothetical protein